MTTHAELPVREFKVMLAALPPAERVYYALDSLEPTIFCSSARDLLLKLADWDEDAWAIRHATDETPPRYWWFVHGFRRE